MCSLIIHLCVCASGQSSSRNIVKVDESVGKSLFELRAKYIKLHQDVCKSLERVLNIPLDDLKETLTSMTEDDTFQKCENYRSFFVKLHSRGDIFNPYVLSGLASTYGDVDTKGYTEQYEACLQEFRQNPKIQQLEGALKLVREERFEDVDMPCVRMKLPEIWWTCVLNDLHVLANAVFGVKSRVLQGPVKIESGCVCITWHVLEHFLESLRETAIERVTVLQQEKLLLLQIGGVTVFQDGHLVKVCECHIGKYLVLS